MTQKEIDLVYSLTIMILEDPCFKENKRTRDEVQAWVTKQLGNNGICTRPIGQSWGVICSKENMEEFLKPFKFER